MQMVTTIGLDIAKSVFQAHSHDLRALLINPRTGKPISKETLQKAFAAELIAAKAKMKALVAQKTPGASGRLNSAYDMFAASPTLTAAKENATVRITF